MLGNEPEQSGKAPEPRFPPNLASLNADSLTRLGISRIKSGSGSSLAGGSNKLAGNLLPAAWFDKTREIGAVDPFALELQQKPSQDEDEFWSQLVVPRRFPPMHSVEWKARLLRSGLLSSDEIERTLAGAPVGIDPLALSFLFVRDGLLTRWQRQQIWNDQIDHLVIDRRYAVLEPIGRGATSQVYRARQLAMNRLVALKIVRSQSPDGPAVLSRFRREVAASARLNHANLLHAHDLIQTDTILALVLEYVDGVNLQQLVERNGPLPIRIACDIIRQAALGIEHAHSLGMVHRDIKPSNILLGMTPAGRTLASWGTVKVLDLGLVRLAPASEKSSKEADGAEKRVSPPQRGKHEASALPPPMGGFGEHPLTDTGAILGTIDYMAPEQADDTHRVDHRADLYSLGATLYFLLTGQPPLGMVDAVNAKMVRLAEGFDVKSVRETRPEVPPDLERLMGRLLARKPADRPKTAADVAQELAWLSEPANLQAKRRNRSSVQPWLNAEGKGSIPARMVPAFARGAFLSMCTALSALALMIWVGLPLMRGPSPAPKEQEAFPAPALVRLPDTGAPPELVVDPGIPSTIVKGCLATTKEFAAVADHDGAVRIWDVQKRAYIGPTLEHATDILSLAFDAPQRRLITLGADRKVRIWDLDRARPIQTLAVAAETEGLARDSAKTSRDAGSESTPVAAEAASFSSDIHDAPDFLEQARAIARSAALSPDGRFLAARPPGRRRIHLWDLRAGRVVAETPFLGCVTFSSDGKRIAGGLGQRQGVSYVGVLDHPFEVSLVKRFPSPRFSFLAITPDNQWILSADSETERQIVLISATTGKQQPTLAPSLCIEEGVRFLDNATALCKGRDDTGPGLFRWQLPDGEPERVQADADNRTASAEPTPAVLVGRKLFDHRLRPFGELPVAGDANRLIGVFPSPDGRRLAFTTNDGELALWDLKEGKLVFEVPTGQPPGGVAFLKSGALLTASQGVILERDATTGMPARPRGHWPNANDVIGLATLESEQNFLAFSTSQAALFSDGSLVPRDKWTGAWLAANDPRSLHTGLLNFSRRGDQFVLAGVEQALALNTNRETGMFVGALQPAAGDSPSLSFVDQTIQEANTKPSIEFARQEDLDRGSAKDQPRLGRPDPATPDPQAPRAFPKPSVGNSPAIGKQKREAPASTRKEITFVMARHPMEASRVLTRTFDHQLRLLDRSLGLTLSTLPAPPPLRYFAYLGDGQRVLAWGADRWRILDANSGKTLVEYRLLAKGRYVVTSPTGNFQTNTDPSAVIRYSNTVSSKTELLTPAEFSTRRPNWQNDTSRVRLP